MFAAGNVFSRRKLSELTLFVSFFGSLGAYVKSDAHYCTTDSSTMADKSKIVRLFLTGDVMLGRGVDQMLRHKVDPVLYESFVKDARDYTQLAVRANGPLPENRSVGYVWGDAIDILSKVKPDARIINLETAVTQRGKAWPYKGINYRMHPGNVEVLTAVSIHCAVLSNNHVLDWDYEGLTDTLQSVQRAGIKTAGAGENLAEARAPAILPICDKGARILVFGIGSPTAGVPSAWRATANRAGVYYVDSLSEHVKEIKTLIKQYKQPNDIVVLSVHWGANWGWDLEPGQRTFAHSVIDEANVDVFHGHSSHHIKGVEIYKGKLIAYGCGDFLSDYEGIGGGHHGEFRDDLSFMYLVDVNKESGKLTDLRLIPMRLKNIRVQLAQGNDRAWLLEHMRRECKKFGGPELDLKSTDEEFRLVFPRN